MGAEREWCKHYVWCNSEKDFSSLEVRKKVPSFYKFCPFCAAPRPEEKKSLAERLRQAKVRHLAFGMGGCSEDSDCRMAVYAKETISAVIEEIEIQRKDWSGSDCVKSINQFCRDLIRDLTALAG